MYQGVCVHVILVLLSIDILALIFINLFVLKSFFSVQFL